MKALEIIQRNFLEIVEEGVLYSGKRSLYPNVHC